MKKLIALTLVILAQNTFAWTIAGVSCSQVTLSTTPNFKTYTFVNLEAGPDAVATISQEIRLENNPSNVGNGMIDHNQYGFFKSRRDMKSNTSIIDLILGQSVLDSILLEDGTLFSKAGSIRKSRLEVIITKRFSDGEAYEAHLNVFTRASDQVDWALSDIYENCSLSVYH